MACLIKKMAYLTLMLSLLYPGDWTSPRDHKGEFRVYSMGFRENMPPGREEQAAIEDDWLVIYFDDAVMVDLGQGWQWIEPQSLVIWAPKTEHRYGNPDANWEHSWMHVGGKDVRPVLAQAGFAPESPAVIGNGSLVETWFMALFNEVSAQKEPDSRILRNLFESWMLAMARARHQTVEMRPLPGVERVKQQLDRYPQDHLSLEAMADIAEISVSYMCAQFKRAYGVSPNKYAQDRRMTLAQFLLRDRQMGISEIASELGYPTVYQFSRMFKRFCGHSPRHYRQGHTS